MKNKLNREQVITLVTDIVYVFIGVLAMIASIAFSYKFLKESCGFNIFWSFILSTIYILFLNLMFEAGIGKFVKSKEMLLEMRKQRDPEMRKRIKNAITKLKVHGYLILVGWLVLVSFSIVSTVGGQYNQLAKIKIDTVDKVNDTSSIRDLEDMIALENESKESYLKELEAIEKRMNTVDTMYESASFRTATGKTEKRADTIRKELKTIKSNIKNYKMQIMRIKENATDITNGNVYKYFERIVKVPGFLIQFFLSFFPSIVLDFFAPVSFAMVIYRRRK